MTRILVVDDDPQILRAMRVNLRAREYDVATAADGTHALRQAGNWRPDLVVLDLGLPDIDGVEVIHGLRGWTQVPVIVLSGRAGSRDKIDALDAGADDYVTKPFDIEELIARIRAVTRRFVTEDSAPVVRVGGRLVDLAGKTVRPADEEAGEVHLTPTEWHLLEILLRNPGKLITQRQLLTEVWGPSYTRETNYLRQYMNQLRRKLEPDPTHPAHLLTEPGMGYRFAP
ncbi:response regulator [Actinomadura vinacea]|uniref:Response regulator n=1 Tax=Actinomadura vinacea TaxID=115336 RepID=A0ABN3KHF6_9ACTN